MNGDSSVTTPSIPLNPAPDGSCYSFIASLGGPELASTVTVAAGRPDGLITTSKPTLDTVFLSPIQAADWVPGSAEVNPGEPAGWELDQMAAVGVDRVVLQNVAGIIDGGAGADTIDTAYPAPAREPTSPGSGSPGFGSATVTRSVAYDADTTQSIKNSKNEVTTLLNAADAATPQVHVVLGLANDSTFDHDGASIMTTCVIGTTPGCQPSPWMVRQVDDDEQIALEVWAMARSHQSFAGWYLPLEFETSGWTTPAARSDLEYLYGQVAAFLAKLTPGKEILLAPYVDPITSSAALPASPSCPWSTGVLAGSSYISAFDTPCQLMGQVRELLEGTKVTEVLLQDGLGDQKLSPYVDMTPAMLPAWDDAVGMAAQEATAERQSTARASGLLDLYSRGTNLDISPSALESRLLLEHQGVDGLGGFSWNQLDPYNILSNQTLFDGYCEYETGQPSCP